jgi:hypothetical protein
VTREAPRGEGGSRAQAQGDRLGGWTLVQGWWARGWSRWWMNSDTLYNYMAWLFSTWVYFVWRVHLAYHLWSTWAPHAQPLGQVDWTVNQPCPLTSQRWPRSPASRVHRAVPRLPIPPCHRSIWGRRIIEIEMLPPFIAIGDTLAPSQRLLRASPVD